MGVVVDYRIVIKNILSAYAQLNPAHGAIDTRELFDDERGRYALVEMGWHDKKYAYGNLIHVELIDGKIWIQYDGTENGIADELVEAGVPKADIVLGFRHPKLRPYTGFATG